MNELIKLINNLGISHDVYMAFHGLGFIAVFIFVLWFGKKMTMKWWQSVLTVLIVFPLVYGLMYVQFWAETGFSKWGGNNIVRVFPYIPFVGILITLLFKIPWKKVCHLLSYAPLVVHGTSHLGCIFFGCCYGYSSKFGIYNPYLETNTFPIQPIEAIAAWGIFAILLIRAKKRNYVSDGLEYPLMLILFGSTRFLFEFLRNNSKLWLGCSNLAFHALFMFVAGSVAYAIIHSRNKQIETISNSQETAT